MNKILLLEDEDGVARSFMRLLGQTDYEVRRAANSDEFYQIYNEHKPDLILLDIELENSQQNGVQIFDTIRRQEDFSSKVIVLSAKATRTQVAEGMKMGAINYIEKGSFFQKEKFLADIHQAMELSRTEKEIQKLRLLSMDALFIGESEAIKGVKKKILMLSPKEMNILITGETGTGKGVVAELVHRNSLRADKPYKVVDIKLIPDSLLESELFGYIKGAFTGADTSKPGYFENADHGTLFMDEISNLSSNEQSKILTVIEEKKIPVVGSGGKTKHVDIRIIAASNKDLTELSVQGDFRDDLYYRLAAGNIHIPPLRERKEDIMLLMQRFLMDSARENRMSLDIDLQAIASELKSYPWPGNVRELKNFANIVTELYDIVDNQVIIKEFNIHKKRNYKLAKGLNKKLEENPLDEIMQNPDYHYVMDTLEKKYLETQLMLHNNKVTQTAKEIGVERTTLYKKMKKLEISFY